MPILLDEENGGKVLAVHVRGRLALADCAYFVPEFEGAVRRRGILRVLFYLTSFRGWEAEALWHEIKFDMKHIAEIERLAIVGETKWRHGVAIFCKPFTNALTRYFGHTGVREARRWLGEV